MACPSSAPPPLHDIRRRLTEKTAAAGQSSTAAEESVLRQRVIVSGDYVTGYRSARVRYVMPFFFVRIGIIIIIITIYAIFFLMYAIKANVCFYNT